MEEGRRRESAKRTLESVPILGHPVQGSVYQLYTDASDYALEAAPQQVQTLKANNLKGMRAYNKLKEAYKRKEAIP